MRETPRAKRAWADYLALGPGRSLEGLLKRYRRASKPPTRRLKTLADWSRQYGWQARLQEIADRETREAEEREAAYRREILEQGYGLAHERVRALKTLAEKLYQELTEDGRTWVQDVKGIGKGDDFERVDIERFNGAEVEQLRGLLDDIAKEKGERKQKVEHSGPEGGPIPIRSITVELPSEEQAT